jgi:hypothetical protein
VFDLETERAVGTCKTVQVVMATGMSSSWKQPIYYRADEAVAKEVLMGIVYKL